MKTQPTTHTHTHTRTEQRFLVVFVHGVLVQNRFHGQSPVMKSKEICWGPGPRKHCPRYPGSTSKTPIVAFSPLVRFLARRRDFSTQQAILRTEGIRAYGRFAPECHLREQNPCEATRAVLPGTQNQKRKGREGGEEWEIGGGRDVSPGVLGVN